MDQAELASLLVAAIPIVVLVLLAAYFAGPHENKIERERANWAARWRQSGEKGNT